MHTGPKKGVEKEYEVYFAKIWDNEIRHTFLSKTVNLKVIWIEFACSSGSEAAAPPPPI